MSLKKILTRLAHQSETGIDLVREALIERLQLDGQPHIRPYIGYGTADRVIVRGRVLRNPPALPAAKDDSFWENALRTYQFTESDEIPHARVRIKGFGDSRIITADEEGFLTGSLRPDSKPPSGKMWQQVELDLLEPKPFGRETVTAPVLIPSPDAAFGIISDVDDTILHSSATRLVQAVRLMFLENAATRTPFPGVAPLYRALQAGKGRNQPPNPIFYVSSSPWNLFEMLTDFMSLQQIPLGPLFLKDYGFTSDQFFSGGHHNHKLAQIDRLFDTYPRLSFILIGDSGQKDPEIYREVALRYPNRIAAIYIRDVSAEKRNVEVERLVFELGRMGIELLLAADSGEVATHAAGRGFISPAAAAEIQAAVASVDG